MPFMNKRGAKVQNEMTDHTDFSIEAEDENLLNFLFLSQVSFISFEEKKKILNNIDSINSLALFSIKDIANLIGRNVSPRAKWNGQETLRLAKVTARYCRLMNVQVLKYSDDNYPEMLLETDNPPLVLFARGDVSILNQKAVAVVGTRNITADGKVAAMEFARAAAADCVNVVSGLAYGVDVYAHKGALKVWEERLDSGSDLPYGKNIAILPGGIDEIVPSGNKKVAAQILQSGGCIISEYGPKIPVEKWQFIARDRLIAGFSPYTVVIEAPAGSGALITADFAVDFNRDVFFHEAAFGNLAKQVAQQVKNNLEEKVAEGKVSRYKVENTPEKFLEAGAPVIKDYKDFCVCLSEPPGKRSCSIQGELFT